MAYSQLERQFQALHKQWNEETAYMSSATDIVHNEAYQQIIALGPQVIPLILEELAEETDHWFWALRTLAGIDAAAGLDSMDQAAQAWLNWGAETGIYKSPHPLRWEVPGSEAEMAARYEKAISSSLSPEHLNHLVEEANAGRLPVRHLSQE